MIVTQRTPGQRERIRTRIAELDHREALPDTMLDAIDGQLKPYGLQIERFDDGGDEYIWRIVRGTTE